MNERFLEAIKKIKEEQDSLVKEIKILKKELEDKSKIDNNQIFKGVAESLIRYTIGPDGFWYFNGNNIGVKAQGLPGKDGVRGPQGLPGKDGVPGKDGRPGKDGLPGKDGRPGRDGAPGKDGKIGLPGRDGKDGITPILKMGKVETSPEYGGALAKLRPGKNNVLYLDLTLPRGPQGFMGFDAKINGQNTLEIVAGDNIKIEQKGKKMIISATGVVPPTPTEDTYFITSDDENFITSDGENFIVADEAPTEDIKLTTNDNKEFITSNNANFIVKESD